MDHWRERRALQVMFPENAERGEADDNEQQKKPSYQVSNELIDRYAAAVAGVMKLYTDNLAASFPEDRLKALIEQKGKGAGGKPQATRAESEGGEPKNTDEEDEKEDDVGELITNWLSEQRHLVEGLLVAALAAAALAAAVDVITRWLAEFAMIGAPQLPLAEFFPAATDQAQMILGRLDEKTRRGVGEIVRLAMKEELPIPEIFARVREFLKEQGFEDAARDLTAEAFHENLDIWNRELGATDKHWVTMKDGMVCGVCSANEQQGSFPLYMLFKSGHAHPPAHPRCRCVLQYTGATTESILESLGQVWTDDPFRAAKLPVSATNTPRGASPSFSQTFR